MLKMHSREDVGMDFMIGVAFAPFGVKLAAVVQRVMSVEGKSDSTEFGLSDEEKKGILDRISKATETIQNEVDDINLQIQE